jgi:ketosteroid isomerase-like protein
MEGGLQMRKLIIACGVAVMVLGAVACRAANADQARMAALQEQADRYEIDQIEKNFHQATTEKNIDLMMSLFAPNATLTIGPGYTVVGLDEIRQAWLDESAAFQPDTHLISDHPAYKVEITVNGDRGTLHFECHYIDYETREVAATTAGDLDVARIDGRWLITNMVAGSADLQP